MKSKFKLFQILFIVFFFFTLLNINAQEKINLRINLKAGESFNVYFNQKSPEEENNFEEEYEEVEPDYENVTIKPDSELDNPQGFDTKGVLKVINEEKDFWTLEYRHTESNGKVWVGELIHKITGQYVNEDLKQIAKKFIETSAVQFNLFKNSNKIEVINFAETSNRHRNAYLNMMQAVDSVIVNPLVELYKSMSGAFDFSDNTLKIIHENYTPEPTLAEMQQMDFSKFMTGFVRLMFDLSEGVALQKFENENDFLFAIYPELMHLFLFHNTEISKSGINLLQFPLTHTFEFYTSGVHTLETQIIHDTITLHGNWFIAESDKEKFKENSMKLSGKMYQAVFNKYNLQYTIDPSLDTNKKKIEAKGNVTYKINKNNNLPVLIEKTVQAELTEGKQNLTLKIWVD
jgi:hypothetical protein